MPPLSETSAFSDKPIKLLLIGDSSTGKTGSLCSLASAGYNLRILDLDNGVDIIRNMLNDPKSPYDKGAGARTEIRTITEAMKVVGGKAIPTSAKAWETAIKMLDHWKYEESGKTYDYGKVSTWGPQDVLVIDSLTRLSTAAFNYHMAMNGKLITGASGHELRRDIGTAQQYVEGLLQLLYADAIKCNVIVISHITFVDDQNIPGGSVPGEAKPQHGYPSTLGKALSPRVPTYFNTCVQMKSDGFGRATRYRLFTQTQGIVNLKTSAPLRVKPDYPVETGLADFFKDLKGPVPQAGARP